MSDSSSGSGSRQDQREPAWSEWGLVAACALLMAAASLPLARVFIGVEWFRTVGATIVLCLGGQALARRMGAGAVVGLVVSAAAWVVFFALLFVPETLAYGVAPTRETATAVGELYVHGLELIQTRPAPTFAEPGLLALAVTGVWWITHAVHVLAVRLRSPLHAVTAALVMWTVPLAIAPAPGEQAWRQAVPLLVAAVALVLLSSDRGLLAGGAARPQAPPRSGWLTGAGAIVAGVLLAGTLPGFDGDPLVRPGPGGGLTQTENPIVDIRANLVDRSEQPVAHVRAPQPVYLRLTSLDVYSANEQWTNDGLSGERISGRLPGEAEQPFARLVDVDIEPLRSHRALVPAPYQATQVSGGPVDDLRWDRDMATLTLATGETLDNGESYEVTAAVPDPPAEALRDADVADADPALTELPSLPDEVRTLARQIVDEAGAETAFDQAMAVQDELRSWEYSLDPPRGHGDSHMAAFVENRQGYCEQFAGTMAAMLRSLDVPARVAVGYTPGEPVGEDEYVVRGRNSHAWVEVLFPGYGWMSFEPTPRDDLNLLTPSADGLAPDELDAERAAEGPAERPDLDFDEDDALDPAQMDDPADGGLDEEPEAAAPGADGEGGPATWWWVGALALGVAGVGALVARRHARDTATVPAEVVLTELERIERLGAGLGRGRRAAETDAEFIRAVAGRGEAAAPLVAAVDRARWSPAVPREDAVTARTAARAIRAQRLDGLGAGTRGRVAARGAWHGARRATAGHVRRLREALRSRAGR